MSTSPAKRRTNRRMMSVNRAQLRLRITAKDDTKPVRSGGEGGEGEVGDQDAATVQSGHVSGAALGGEAGRREVAQDRRVPLDRVDRPLRRENPHHPSRSVAALDPEHVTVELRHACDAGAVRGLEMPGDLASGKASPQTIATRSQSVV